MHYENAVGIRTPINHHITFTGNVNRLVFIDFNVAFCVGTFKNDYFARTVICKFNSFSDCSDCSFPALTIAFIVSSYGYIDCISRPVSQCCIIQLVFQIITSTHTQYIIRSVINCDFIADISS